MENRKGFTLIELLAVIVILGILMLIAIPSVTKYIDSSKKETYVKTVSNMVDVVRYGVVSENSNYSMGGKTEKAFLLSKVELEKGSNKSPYGDFIDEYSYVIVTKTNSGYKYEVQAKDTGNYCIELVNIDDLDKNKIINCNDDNMVEGPLYDEYKIGAKIEFAGSNWYVIKNSPKNENYVTLIKEKVLTNVELGSNASKPGYDTMAYYWSDTCHTSGYYGYTSLDFSGCKGHGDYNSSKIKEFLEGSYINTLGSDKLKSVDGYKIRLIKRDELTNNLGWNSGDATTTGNDVPTWVYQNFGYTNGSNGLYSYWIMTPRPDIVPYVRVYAVQYNGGLTDSYVVGDYYYNGIRPVINLLKSNISQ